MTQIPVLWLCGPPGAGKTAVAWTLYERLLHLGGDPAFVDIDQVGICSPEMPNDPDRHILKARNLAVLRASFADAGRRCLLVSGVVDARRALGPAEVGGGSLTLVRLRADPESLRARLAGRPGVPPDIDAAVEEARSLDQSSFADVTVETSDLDVVTVADRVEERVGEWSQRLSWEQGNSLRGHGSAARRDERRSVVFLTGPTGVGKSTVGFSAFREVLRGGTTAAFVDVDQICFAGSRSSDHGLRARNLAAVWSNFRDRAAEVLVAVGPIGSAHDAQAYLDLLGPDTVTWIRLAASRETLLERILSRSRGGSWAQPGDPLIGLSEAQAHPIVDRAVAESNALQSVDLGPILDVDRLGPDQAARTVIALHRTARST